MKDIPSRVRRFVLNFGDKEIKAVRLFNQELPIYDKNGSLKDSVIYFYPVDDFNEADFDFSYSNLERDKMMVINYKNFPKKVWWYDITKNQKHLSGREILYFPT